MPSHHSTCLSPDGPTQNSRRDFSFCARLPEVWSTLLRPWIVPSHHFTPAVTEGDGSVRVLGHQGAIQPPSNSKPTLRTLSLMRNSHVAAPMLRWSRRSTKPLVNSGLVYFSEALTVDRIIKKCLQKSVLTATKRNPGQSTLPGSLQVVASACRFF
jgi:hypothetical protein